MQTLPIRTPLFSAIVLIKRGPFYVSPPPPSPPPNSPPTPSKERGLKFRSLQHGDYLSKARLLLERQACRNPLPSFPNIVST